MTRGGRFRGRDPVSWVSRQWWGPRTVGGPSSQWEVTSLRHGEGVQSLVVIRDEVKGVGDLSSSWVLTEVKWELRRPRKDSDSTGVAGLMDVPQTSATPGSNVHAPGPRRESKCGRTGTLERGSSVKVPSYVECSCTWPKMKNIREFRL